MRYYILLSIFVVTMDAKVFKKCEFAKLAKDSGLSDIDKWTCIAFRESRFNSKAKNGNLYGILQISGEDWCGRGRKCGISCDSLLDADIKDDLLCAKKIYNATARHAGRSGFSPWSSSNYCKGDLQHWINKCSL